MANNLRMQLLISAIDGASSVLRGIGGVIKWLDSTVSVSANAMRAALSKVFVGPVETASDFEEAMARINAVMRPTAAEFEALRTKALEMGRDTRYTATEAANALEILAKAGFNAKDAITALPSVLSLAQSQSISLAESAGYVSDTLTIFGLAADQSNRVVNVLAKTASNAKVEISDLGQSIKYVGPTAAQAGLSLEQIAAILDVLAKNGLRADMAGTSLRDLLQDINDPASEARKSLRALGIETNNFMEVVSGLERAGINGAQAIQDFGVRSSGAMMVIARTGVAGIKQFEQSIIDANKAEIDYAEKSRQIMDATVKGAWFAFSSSLEAAQLALATPILDPLQRGFRQLSDTVNNLVKSGILQDIGQDVADVFQRASSSALTWLKNLDWNQLKADAKSVVGEIKGAITDLENNIKGTAQEISDWATVAFAPFTLIKDQLKLTAASAAGDTKRIAEAQDQLKELLDALTRVLNGTSAEYAKLETASQQAAQGQKDAGQSIDALTSKAAAQQAAVNSLVAEIDKQKEVTTALAESSQARVTADESANAEILKQWELEQKLVPLQADLAKTQADLAKAQQAGAKASAAMTPEIAALTAEVDKQRAKVAALTTTTGTLTDAHAKALPPAAVIGREMEKLAILQERLEEAQKQAITQQTALTASQTQGAAAAQQSAAATQKYSIAWSESLPVQEKAQSVVIKTATGYGEVTRASGAAAVAQKDLRTETERLNSSASGYGSTQKTVNDTQGQAVKTIEQYRQRVDETRRAMELAEKSDANAADYTQKLNAARQEARNALNQLEQAILKQSTAAQHSVDTAIAQRNAVIKTNEADTAAVQLKLRLALAEQDAYAIGQQTVAQQVNVLRNAQALETALQNEARSLKAKADADLEAYKASLLNNNLAPEVRQKMLESAQQSAAAANAKQEEVRAIHEKVDALSTELASQQTANQLTQQAAYVAEQGSSSYRALADAKVNAAQAALKLAQATGDEQQIAAATEKVQAAQVDQAKALSQSKQDAADAAYGAVAALQRQAEADGIVTKEEKKAIDSAYALADSKRIEAEAAKAQSDAMAEVAKTTKEAAGATESLKQAAQQSAVQGSIVSDIYGGWINRLDQLSGAAVAAFQTLRGATVTATNDSAHELENLEKRIESTRAILKTISPTETGLVGWARATAAAAIQVEQAFLSEAQSAESLTQKLQTATQSGGANLGFLARQADVAKDRFTLLDQTRLDNLSKAIDAARQKMDELRQSSEDALTSAEQALLQAQGDEAGQLKFEYERKRAELQKQLNAAQAAANTDAVNNLKKALDLEKQTYDIKSKKLKEQNKSSTSGGSTTTSKTNTSGSVGGGRTGTNGAAGSTTQNFIFPNASVLTQDFVKQIARAVSPEMDNIARRKA